MKKLFSIILSLIIINVMSVNVYAVDSNATLSLNYIGAADVGEEIALNINLSDNSNLSALVFNIIYDSNNLEFVDIKENSEVLTNSVADINVKTPGKVTVGAVTSGSWKNGGAAFTVTFKVLKVNAAVKLELVEACLGDFDGTDVTEFVAANSDTELLFACPHSNTQWKITVEPTFTTEGTKVRYCLNCDKVLETESIPKIDSVLNGINIIRDSVDIKRDESLKLDVEIIPEDALGYTLQWISSDPQIVAVDQNGNIQGDLRGNCTITCIATDSSGNTFTDTCRVNVDYTFGQWLLYIFFWGFIWFK